MTDEREGRLARWIEQIEHNAFGAIYGAITVLALLMAMGHSATDPITTAAILFGSVLAITRAKAFAQISADAAHHRAAFGWAEVRAGWRHAQPTLIAANIPTLLIALAATGAYSAETAIDLSQVFAILLLAVYGFSIGWVIYRRVLPGLLHGAFTGAIGLALALLKFVLH
ncbi:hypothetical protein [Yoonia sp. 2307UL14-13]|uniref:hypothetical protein n=1 Tax=Yoonia sp. 2307UL14-13 TaxID=3126506 RepID=UPI00309515F5